MKKYHSRIIHHFKLGLKIKIVKYFIWANEVFFKNTNRNDKILIKTIIMVKKNSIFNKQDHPFCIQIYHSSRTLMIQKISFRFNK